LTFDLYTRRQRTGQDRTDTRQYRLLTTRTALRRAVPVLEPGATPTCAMNFLSSLSTAVSRGSRWISRRSWRRVLLSGSPARLGLLLTRTRETGQNRTMRPPYQSLLLTCLPPCRTCAPPTAKPCSPSPACQRCAPGRVDHGSEGLYGFGDDPDGGIGLAAVEEPSAIPTSSSSSTAASPIPPSGSSPNPYNPSLP
jgi:hypothetical protein